VEAARRKGTEFLPQQSIVLGPGQVPDHGILLLTVPARLQLLDDLFIRLAKGGLRRSRL
jgi:hypothetical protein